MNNVDYAKGKPAERQGRKAASLRPYGYDSRAAIDFMNRLKIITWRKKESWLYIIALALLFWSCNTKNIKKEGDTASVRLYTAHMKQQKLKKQLNTNLHKRPDITGVLKKLDLITYRHSISVANLALMFVDFCGYDLDPDAVYYAGLYHDIGKYHIDPDILNKPSKLNEEEFEEIKKHPEIGYRMLKDTDLSDMVLDAALYHHEKYNGQGYPFGLAGDEIPLIARIIQICDVFDALTSDRPYRKGHKPEESLRIMQNTKEHYDPVLFHAFISMIL